MSATTRANLTKSEIQALFTLNFQEWRRRVANQELGGILMEDRLLHYAVCIAATSDQINLDEKWPQPQSVKEVK